LKKSDKIEAKLDSWAAECLFGSTYLLLSLCEGERQLTFYRQFYSEEKDKKLPTRFFEGFKLALTALLHRIVSQVIEAPGSIGIRRSERIEWTYSFGLDEKRTIHELPNACAQGILVENLLTFRKRILESKDWESLWVSIEPLRDFLHSVQEIFLSCYVGRIDKSNDVLSPENALGTKLPELILIFMNDEKFLQIAFKEMYRRHPQAVRLEQYKTPLEPKPTQAEEAQEDEDPLQVLRKEIFLKRAGFFEAADKASIFFEGYKFANLSLWQFALGEKEFVKSTEIFRGVQKVETWTAFDEQFDIINQDVVSQFESTNRSNETDLVLTKKVLGEIKHKLIVPIRNSKTLQSKLADALDHRPAKVIGFEGSNGVSQFCTVLLGLVTQHRLGMMHEKPQVIEFIHKQRTRGNDYSYALFIPTSSNMADYSRWWIFYRCATDHSGYGGFCFTQIRSYIESLKTEIRIRRFHVNEESFLDYFKSDYIQFIEEECKKATEDNRSLRGAFLELLVGYIFIQNGFKVLLRHRSPLIGRKEIDVIATKEDNDNTTIYVVECKERSLAVGSEEYEKISNELFKKAREKGKGVFSLSQSGAMYKVIDDFEKEKVTPLRAKLQEFAKEINHPIKDGMKLIGLLATTELLEANEQISPDIELWTYWTLKKKIQEIKIDKSFIEIIEKNLEGSVGRPIADLHFYKDYFD
jgi:hypothetical protein